MQIFHCYADKYNNKYRLFHSFQIYIWFKTPLNWGISKLATIQLPSLLFSHIL